MIPLRLPTAFLVALAATAAVAATPAPPAPATKTVAATDTVQGVKVADPYRWLENTLDPAVKAWSDAQNVRTRAYLDAVPGREGVEARLTSLIQAASPATSALSARGDKVFALYADPALQQPQLVVMDADANPASRRVLIDPNAMDKDGAVEIDWFEPSPDGSKVAVSLSRNGSEDGSLHLYDAISGREMETVIPRVQYPTAGGSLAWARDGRGFWYTRYPGEEFPPGDRHFFQQVYFHRLGDDWKADALALGTRDGVPRTGEIYLDNRYGALDALASVQLGDGGQWRHYVLRGGSGGLVQIADYADRIVAAAIGSDGEIYGVSRKDAPNGKVLKFGAPYAAGFANAKVIVPEGPRAIVSDQNDRALTLTRDRLFVREIDGGPSAVRIYDLEGGGGTDLAIPPVSDIPEMEPLPSGDVLYAVASYLRPPYSMRWEARTGATFETKLRVISPIDYSDVEVVRDFAASKDGTRIPLNIIRRKGTRLDGSNPTLLYGYGGYGVNMTPAFLGAARRLWLDAGGVFVIANIRGGAEYGERWHTQGALTNKQTVFDDFYAAGQWLLKTGYTRYDRFALQGGSNGGLLMGATLTQHPDLAKAVVSQVGIYDMVRVELDPNGAFNTTEFGSVKDPAQFRALYAYSPYHHVKAGVQYPAVLLTTGANDGRVNAMQSRKFAAALQAAGGGGPILLRTSQNTGHGLGSSLDERIGEQTDWLMFLYDQLGMTAPAGAPDPR